jgi:TPP-dependent indolepyruvate ferredoxin oxidoreductase alpha subunit
MELVEKYRKHFVLKQKELSLLEAKVLLSELEKEPVSLQNEEMMSKLRYFISKKESLEKRKNDQENKVSQASEEFDHYHEKLKEMGVVVVQPGVEYNGKRDIYMTYHYKGEVIYKWYNGTHVTVLAPEIKKVYEGLAK